jgi:hypothetical protein
MRRKSPPSRRRRRARPVLDTAEKRAKVERAHAQERLEATQDYVRRGRNLEHLDTESLKQHWIAALTAWFSHRSQETTRGFDDAASELGLRGLVPEELIPREIAAALQAEMDRDMDDPEAAAAFEQMITEYLSREGPRH